MMFMDTKKQKIAYFIILTLTSLLLISCSSAHETFQQEESKNEEEEQDTKAEQQVIEEAENDEQTNGETRLQGKDNENKLTSQNDDSEDMSTKQDNASGDKPGKQDNHGESKPSWQDTTDENNVEDKIAKREPVKVKGIYVTAPIAGTEKIDELIQLVDETELNALVIDVKDDDGRITYAMECEAVKEIDAQIRYISDINSLIQKCKGKDIYLIARIVTFKDPYLALQHPEYAIKKKNGEVFYDKSHMAWVNPYNKQVWDYLMEVATQAALDGFDEIQFDYVRFSTDLKSNILDFGEESKEISKTEIITEFTRYACEKLTKLGVFVSADVYGTVIDSKIDQDIVGQNYTEMAKYLDYICPMVYPSHYANGVYGISIPDADPYHLIKEAMSSAKSELGVLPENNRAANRAWLQGFTASWVEGHISYGLVQIREQIKGAYEAGCDEWIIWNAAVRYPRENFLTEEEAALLEHDWNKMLQENLSKNE